MQLLTFLIFFLKELLLKEKIISKFASKKKKVNEYPIMKMANDFKQIDIHLFVGSKVTGETKLIRNSSKWH